MHSTNFHLCECRVCADIRKSVFATECAAIVWVWNPGSDCTEREGVVGVDRVAVKVCVAFCA